MNTCKMLIFIDATDRSVWRISSSADESYFTPKCDVLFLFGFFVHRLLVLAEAETHFLTSGCKYCYIISDSGFVGLFKQKIIIKLPLFPSQSSSDFCAAPDMYITKVVDQNAVMDRGL